MMYWRWWVAAVGGGCRRRLCVAAVDDGGWRQWWVEVVVVGGGGGWGGSGSDFKMSNRVGETAVGIHFGTTNACVVAWFVRRNKVEIIPNVIGNKITPACVAWDGRELLAGEAAKNLNTVFDVKHLKRSKRNDIRVNKGMALWPYMGIDFFHQFTRANFEYLNHGFFDKCIEHVESCLKDGDMHKKGVDNVVLVAVLAAKLGGIGKQLMQDLNKITEKRFLNTSELDGIPADRAGAQKLKVSFEMDANGNLNVSAVVKCNGNKRSYNCQEWKSVKR
ncbi:heat shock cognate 70 kDa protein-like protein [Tanacetum coccineum]|uniref:Heat shock cognate 70 kDa protein-like protein n=1 Tax=Tanacetum coccineum TaxID=301880 RepID=A0ABQ5AF66_9ASTR